MNDDAHEMGARTWLAFAAMAATIAIAMTLAVGLQNRAALLLGIAATVVTMAGVYVGKREAVGAGVFVLAATSLLTTHDLSQSAELGLSAGYAVGALAILLTAELSFLTRRAGVIDQSTLAGFIAVHVAAALAAIIAVVAVLAAMLGLSWSGWFLLVPAVVFAAGSILLLRLSGTHTRAVAAQPLPPPPMLAVRRRPPPPPPTSKPPW